MSSYFLIGVQPKDKSVSEEIFDLEDYDDKESLFDAIDRTFNNTISKAPRCPICNGTTKWDPDSPSGWFCKKELCNGKVWSDELERDVDYSVDKTTYYGSILDQYGIVTSCKVHKDFADFINTIFDAENNNQDDALMEYLENMHFDADRHDITDVYKNFKEDYVGYAKTTDDNKTEEWFGEWLVEQGLVDIPEHLQDCIDYGYLASDYFVGGDYWYSNGHIFQSR